MRVITGIARGRKLLTLEGEDIRPTSDRVKEAIFSIIQFEIEGRRVLDLFAGSGQLGIEALSRGAKSAVFVDSSPAAIDVIKQNVQKCGLEKQAVILNTDAISFLRGRKDIFDIAFLDPPYGKGIIEMTLPSVAERMSPGGVIICETLKIEETPAEAGDFAKDKTYIYGKTAVALYRKENGI